MNNKVKNSLLSAFIILVTAGIFLLLNKEIFDVGMCWYTFSVIMVSEIVLAFAWVTFKGIPQRFAVIAVSFFQTLANIFASILFINLLIEAYVLFTVYTILSFAVLVVLAFFFYNASAVSEKTSDAKDFFTKCRLTVNAISNSSGAEKYREQLLKLEENIRFCNDGILLESDNEIYEAICDLKNEVSGGSKNVGKTIEKINAMLSQHDTVAKATKR